MTADFVASRFSLIVVLPVTPSKSRVAASASRTFGPSVVPARFIASARIIAESYPTAGRRKSLLEVFRQALAVITFYIGQQRNLLRFQCFRGKIRHDRALEGIDKTNPENVVAGLSHFRVG